MGDDPLAVDDQTPCCDHRDHSPGPCPCPEHDTSEMHPFGPRRCAYCKTPIIPGQHYVRLAVLLDTAGREIISLLDLPDSPMWSKIFDEPACAGIALVLAGTREEFFTDVFGR